MRFTWDDLKGKIVNKVLLDDEKQNISFVFSDGSRQDFYCDGECCSNTWIEHINGLNNLLNQPISGVDDKYLKAEDHNDYDCLKYYSLTISTPAGYFDIEYRNSSNGYYGGRLAVCEFRGSELDKFEELKEDF